MSLRQISKIFTTYAERKKKRLPIIITSVELAGLGGELASQLIQRLSHRQPNCSLQQMLHQIIVLLLLFTTGGVQHHLLDCWTDGGEWTLSSCLLLFTLGQAQEELREEDR